MWHPPERIKHPLPDHEWPTSEQAAGARLFSPVQIGTRQAKQRTWVPAMVPWRATEGGEVTEEVIEWYRRFAKGKPGVIVVEATGIRDIPSGPLLRIGHDRFIPGLCRLVEAVREASAGETMLFIQIIDFLSIKRRPPKQKYLERFLQVEPRHARAMRDATGEDAWLSADESQLRGGLMNVDESLLPRILDPREFEDLARGYRERVSDVHLPHIRELPVVLPGLFADASHRAFEAGFDGVELHYAHAYTMASFLSRLNDRSDGYGGNRASRVRLPLEVIEEVRNKIGSDQVLGARFLGDDVIESGLRVEDAAYYAVEFARASLDYLSVSKGGKFEDAKAPRVGEAVYPYTGQSGYECMPTIYSDQRGPFGRNVELAATIKSAVNEAGFQIPVVTAGGIGTFTAAEDILQSGAADIVGAARASIADPDWFLKMKLGRGQEIRRCEYTNYCEALDQKHKTVTCKLWDRTHLDEPGIQLDVTKKRRLLAPDWNP